MPSGPLWQCNRHSCGVTKLEAAVTLHLGVWGSALQNTPYFVTGAASQPGFVIICVALSNLVLVFLCLAPVCCCHMQPQFLKHSSIFQQPLYANLHTFNKYALRCTREPFCKAASFPVFMSLGFGFLFEIETQLPWAPVMRSPAKP